MLTRREEKFNSLARELASEFILREVKLENALITVMRTEASHDLRNLKIFITVYPETGEKKALKMLNQKKREWNEYLSLKLKGKFISHSEFLIDESEKKRQRVEELLK